jgi:predicted transcriptional regulator
MTMMSFRVEDDEAAHAQRWAEELGIHKSELLRDALHRHLTRLAFEHDALAWAEHPLTADESAIGQIAEWAPAEDWSDWADAAR